jgi:hypothetical protein
MAIPSPGKLDACPGRFKQNPQFFKEPEFFINSEICVLITMPIVIEVWI